MASKQAIKDMLFYLEEDIAILASVYQKSAEADNEEMHKWEEPFCAVNYDHYLTRESLNKSFWNELCGIIERLHDIREIV